MIVSLSKRCTLPVLLSFLILTAQAQTSTKSQTLFFVNDKPITTEEFVYLYRKNHQHKPEEFTEEKIEEYLSLFINYKLKVEEALSRGMDTTTAFKKEYQGYREELLKPYLPDSRVVDSLVALTYERLKEEVNASHILIRLDANASPADTLGAYEKIMAIRARATAGEDFNSLAATQSEEPGAATSKGNLGYFTAMQMVFPFEQAAYTTPVGEVSLPVRTQFGYHLVKVHDRQPSRGEVEVSHIMIRAGDEERADEARNLIFDIHDKLQKGVRWEELCAQYSEDPNTRETGGRLRPFGVGGMASAPEFQEMAFALQNPGEISDPVQTRYGWHILRLEKKIPLPSFEEMKGPLTQRVSRDERVRISKEALREKMRTAFAYQERASVKNELFARVEDFFSGTADDLNQKVLFSMQGRDYQVKDFRQFIKEKGGQGGQNKEGLEQRLNEYTDHVQMLLLEEDVKRRSSDYKWLLKEYYEGILLFEIMEKEIWNKAMEDSLGQRRYFEQNASKYQAGERANARIFSSTSASSLNELKNVLYSRLDSLNAFLKKQRIRLDSGSFEKSDRAVLAKISWAPGTYIAQNAGMHHLIVVDKILPPGPKTFEEARASVISDYQTFLEDSWISELKRKFGVKVEKRAKKRAFAELMDQ